MKKSWVFLLVSMLVACTTQDETYYRNNPQELQEAMKACPEKQPSHMSCQQLQELALDVNQLAMELQRNPQQFGQKIIQLQEQLADIENQMKNDPQSVDSNAKISEIKIQLANRLAVVKWLETPEG